MKTRNLVFGLLISGLGIGFFGCIGNGGGNISNFPVSPAVVGYNMDMGGTTISTPYGLFAAPDLIIYPEGDCLMLSFTYDADNQPSTLYYTASNIQVSQEVTQKGLENVYGPINIGAYTLPISAVGMDANPIYGGKVFFQMTCKDNKPDFRLAYNSQEPDSAGIKNLYLLAQPSSPTTTDVPNNLFAFDIMYWIQSMGRDTTITVSGSSTGTDLKYIRANLKYFTGMSSDSVPVFGQANTVGNPVVFYAFK